MPGLPDERPVETLCPAVPRLGHQRGALLHPAGGPAERPEETRHHGLQDGSQVGLRAISFFIPEVTSPVLCCRIICRLRH